MAIRLSALLLLIVLALFGVLHVGSRLEPAPPEEPAPDWVSRVQSELMAREYRPSETRRGLQAPNRAHGLRSYFEPTGVRVVDRTAPGGPELVSLSLSGMGRGDGLEPVAPGEVSHADARVEIARDEIGLVEWYVNSPDGLEQGFTLAEAPRGQGPLALEVSVSSAAVSLLDAALAFRSAAGRRLRYAKLVAEDAEGAVLPSHFEVSDAGFRIVVDDVGATYPVVIDPLLTETFDHEIESNQISASLGRSVAAAGDVNGDGYADVIVGAFNYDSGETDEGAAFVFHGSAGGIGDGNPINRDAFLQSNQASSRFGRSVASAGDVNGDGYDDVIVGAELYDAIETNEGAAFLFLGSAAGIADGNPATAHTQLESDQANANLGVSVASAGDVNGDGYGDVIAGAINYDAGETGEGAAFVFLGSAVGIPDGNPATAHAQLESDQASAFLGDSVASAGDVNGDGYGDVIVGADRYDAGESNEGAAFVFLGSAVGIADGDPGSAHAQVESDQANALLGKSVAAAGDVNGDGYGDVVVGSYFYDDGETNEGAVLVVHGSATGLPASTSPLTANAYLQSNQATALFGWSVAAAGDVNGDGYGDVVLGAHGYDAPESNEGSAFVFLGSATGIASDAAATDAYAQLESNQANAQLGIQVASAGDVNGDGFADLILGAHLMDGPESDEGQAFVYHGGAIGHRDTTIVAADATLTTLASSPTQVLSVASAGDVNADGYGDVIFGVSDYDGGEVDEGAAFVFLGGAAGIANGDVTSADSQLESDEMAAFMGWSVASAGDVNGDGYGDVIVGAPFYDAGGDDEGAAFVFLGSAVGIASGDPGTAHAQLESDQDFARLGESVASAGDVNGDGFADVIVGAFHYDAGQLDEGAAFVFLGGVTGIADGDPATAHALFESDQSSADFGLSVASAGDVNGDGYGDVIIGATRFDAGQSDEGAAFVFLGSADGIAGGNPGTAHAQLESQQVFASLGWSVASAGDVNGDGYDDVIVGAIRYDSGQTDEGAAFVFLGSASGIADGDPATAAAELESDQQDGSLGRSVASAGDVNGDGYGDVVVGAPGFSNPLIGEGAVFVFVGSAAGIADGNPATADTRIEGLVTGLQLGAHVGSAGDVNGDGHGDLIAAPLTGGTLVFLGDDDGRPVRPRQLRGDSSGVPVQPWGESIASDAFQAELLVTSPRGRERAKLEIEACLAGAPFGDPACTRDVSAAWIDLGLSGTTFTETISGLTPGLHHWRARALYAPLHVTEPGITPIPRAGPWRRVGGQAGNADIRVLPEPHAAFSLLAGFALLMLLERRNR